MRPIPPFRKRYWLKKKRYFFKQAFLLYGWETWRMTKLDLFLHKSLNRLMKIYWPVKISNDEIRNRASISTISTISLQIHQRRWRFISCILGMNANQHPTTAITWAPERERRRGRPRETWRRTAKKKRTASGFTSWSGAAVVALDRVASRRRMSRGLWIKVKVIEVV